MPRSSVIFCPQPTGRGLLRHLPAIALCVMLAGASAPALLAATATTTALTVSPTALAPGKAARLVATVTDASNKSVFPGTVNFYDGTRFLGTAQLVSHPGGGFAEGTATCLVPVIDGAYFSEREKEALWDRFFTGAPQGQRRSVEGYSIVKRA